MASQLDLDNFLCFSVYSVGHAFNQFYRPILEAIGLTYPQYLVMVALWTRDDRTMKDLGAELMLESNTLTPLLKRLEGMSLIRRIRDANDERQVRLQLTAEGHALREKAEAVPGCISDVLGLSDAERVSLMTTLGALRDRLRRDGAPGATGAGD